MYLCIKSFSDRCRAFLALQVRHPEMVIDDEGSGGADENVDAHGDGNGNGDGDGDEDNQRQMVMVMCEKYDETVFHRTVRCQSTLFTSTHPLIAHQTIIRITDPIQAITRTVFQSSPPFQVKSSQKSSPWPLGFNWPFPSPSPITNTIPSAHWQSHSLHCSIRDAVFERAPVVSPAPKDWTMAFSAISAYSLSATLLEHCRGFDGDECGLYGDGYPQPYLACQIHRIFVPQSRS